MNETEFEKAVVDLAHMFGWKVDGRSNSIRHGKHTTANKHDGDGWPDLTLVHPDGRIVFAELKVGYNKRSTKQEEWGDLLYHVAEKISFPQSPPPVAYRLWYPKHADEIAYTLSGGRITEWNLT